jgi:iron(III) transport system substrate-binding protein
MSARQRGLPAPAAACSALLCLLAGCSGWTEKPSRDITVYTSVDREFSEPIFKGFTARTGIDVRPRYDVESTKTVGLTEAIIREAPYTRCDLFWNNEILHTIRLRSKGLLVPFRPPNAAAIPAQYQAKDGSWFGFAARARILLVNTKLVADTERPTGMDDLVKPKWKGKIGIAKPLFGTTATHAACLFVVWGDARAKAYFQALKANGVQVMSGNKQVATAVGTGELAVGLTDTDDAVGELAAGSPVAIVYPDREPDQLGTLFVPTTLALIKGAPHKRTAEELANFLLSPDVESILAKGPSAQIPLNPKVTAAPQVETPKTVHPMKVDFEAAARRWDEVAAFLAAEFAG